MNSRNPFSGRQFLFASGGVAVAAAAAAASCAGSEREPSRNGTPSAGAYTAFGAVGLIEVK